METHSKNLDMLARGPSVDESGEEAKQATIERPGQALDLDQGPESDEDIINENLMDHVLSLQEAIEQKNLVIQTQANIIRDLKRTNEALTFF